jgi:pyruvyl transferase EpsO
MSLNEQWRTTLVDLKSMHEDIYLEIGEGCKVAYLDFPMHFNVGDLLIFKGTEQFFIDYNIDVVYRESKTKFTVNYKAINKADVILFHGGGNFGDIYPDFQRYRDRIIRKFPNKKIIILPQSVFFNNECNVECYFQYMSFHKNLLLYVRDNESLKLLEKYGIRTKIMPDMAHSLHPLKDISEVGSYNRNYFRVLNLKRGDREKLLDNKIKNISKKSFDWNQLVTISDKIIYFVCKVFLKIPIIRVFFMSLYCKLTDDIVFKAIFYFDQHDVVHTDRLHGFILSVLLGKEVVLNDNNYGKNTRYCSLWLSKYPFLSRNITRS